MGYVAFFDANYVGSAIDCVGISALVQKSDIRPWYYLLNYVDQDLSFKKWNKTIFMFWSMIITMATMLLSMWQRTQCFSFTENHMLKKISTLNTYFLPKNKLFISPPSCFVRLDLPFCVTNQA